MYRYLDRPRGDLAPGEQMLLWSMRSWVTAMAGQHCPCATLGPWFERWRVADLLPDFNMAMFLLNGEAQVRLCFAPPGCGMIRDDEAMLLALFDAAAGRDEPHVGRIAAQLVVPEAMRPLIVAVVASADVLRRKPVPRNSDS